MVAVENFDLEKWMQRARHWIAFIGLRRLLTGVFTACVLAGVGWFIMKPSPVPVEAFVPHVSAVAAPSTVTVAPAHVTVHVAGAVNNPGVYQLSSSARVVDAISAAGGALQNADLESINLAQTIVDTEQVYVPAKRAARPRITVAPRLRPRRNSATTVPSLVGGSGGAPVSKLVNLNTATATELDSLTGVGPSTAKAIISYRTKKGSFTKVEDLLNVPGIGPAKLAAMREEVTVG